VVVVVAVLDVAVVVDVVPGFPLELVPVEVLVPLVVGVRQDALDVPAVVDVEPVIPPKWKFPPVEVMLVGLDKDKRMEMDEKIPIRRLESFIKGSIQYSKINQ